MFLILVCFYLDLDYKTCFSRVKSNRISLSLLGKNVASNLKLRLAISRQRIFPKLSVSMALNWNFYITRLFCMKPCYCLYFSFFYFTRRNTFKKRKLKVTMMKKILRFPSFQVCPKLNMKDLEISESFLLLELLTVVVTQKWKMT